MSVDQTVQQRPRKFSDYPYVNVKGCEGRRNGDRRAVRVHGPGRFACYEGDQHRGIVVGGSEAVGWLEGEDNAVPTPYVSVEPNGASL